MYRKIINTFKNEKANAVVENVVILPLVFVIIIYIIITCFVVHDRTTIEAAAKRGAIYASHCIANPNYSSILTKSLNDGGSLDIKETITTFTFTNIGKNVQPYRYLKSKTKNLDTLVRQEVEKIISKTQIPWRPIKYENIVFTQNNKIYYQDVQVSITASYPLPKALAAFGVETEFEYTVTAKMAVNDPDEFIRNTDLVVDLIVEFDNAVLGGKGGEALKKIEGLSSKLIDWLKDN